MKNQKNFFIFILIIALGAAFSLIKPSISSKSTNDNMRILGKEMAEMDLKPFARSDKGQTLKVPSHKYKAGLKNSKTKQMMRLAGMNRKHTFEHPEDKNLKDKSKDKKKKKKKDKKKKKKKKKKGKSSGADDLDGKDDRDSADESGDDADTTDDVYGGGGGFVPPAPQNNGGELPTTYEEWAEILLNTPEKKETEKFISYYQMNLVSADIFYKIVDEMLNDSRDEMIHLGITCAGATPSYQSFMALTHFIELQSFNSPLRARATNEVQNDYTSLRTLRDLESVLALSNEAFPVILAANSAESTAVKYLKPVERELSTETNGAQPQNQESTHPNASRFYNIRSILERIVVEGGDPQVVDAASKTLQTIEKLLNS